MSLSFWFPFGICSFIDLYNNMGKEAKKWLQQFDSIFTLNLIDCNVTNFRVSSVKQIVLKKHVYLFNRQMKKVHHCTGTTIMIHSPRFKVTGFIR